MRWPLAAPLLLAALAGGAALGGCTEAAKCTANADCPAQNYCLVADGGTQGTCRHDCQATADCHDPALRCSSLGQCIPVAIPAFDAGVDAAPDAVAPADGADAAPPDDAGGTD